MLRLARRSNPGLDFHEAEAEALSVAAATFDLVMIEFGVLHFASPIPGRLLAFLPPLWRSPESPGPNRCLNSAKGSRLISTRPSRPSTNPRPASLNPPKGPRLISTQEHANRAQAAANMSQSPEGSSPHSHAPGSCHGTPMSSGCLNPPKGPRLISTATDARLSRAARERVSIPRRVLASFPRREPSGPEPSPVREVSIPRRVLASFPLIAMKRKIAIIGALSQSPEGSSPHFH